MINLTLDQKRAINQLREKDDPANNEVASYFDMAIAADLDPNNWEAIDAIVAFVEED